MKDRDEQKGKPEIPYRVYPDRAALSGSPNFDTMQFFHLDAEDRLGYSRYTPGTSDAEIVSIHQPPSVREITASGSAVETDDIILVNASGSTVLTLASGSTVYYPLTVKNIHAAGFVTITPQAGETIDGAGSFAIPAQYGAYSLAPYGANWYIISKV